MNVLLVLEDRVLTLILDWIFKASLCHKVVLLSS